VEEGFSSVLHRGGDVCGGVLGSLFSLLELLSPIVDDVLRVNMW